MNACCASSPSVQATAGWETPTQTRDTVRSHLAPVSSATPLSTWPRKRGDSVTLEELGNLTLGDLGWNEEPPLTLTSTVWGRNTSILLKKKDCVVF